MGQRLLQIAAEDRAIRIRVEEVDHPGDPGLGGPAAVVAAQRHRTLRLAVERAPLREDLVPLSEEAGDLDGVLVRLAAARREDGLREVPGRYLGEQARESGAALLPERGGHIAGALGLLLNGPHHLRVAVAEVDVNESRGEIEDPALARVEPGALGARDDDLLDATLRGPGHEDVVGGVLGDGGRVGGALRGDGHRAESRPRKRTTAGTVPGGRS